MLIALRGYFSHLVLFAFVLDDVTSTVTTSPGDSFAYILPHVNGLNFP
jgi:hypothetical protein